MTRNSHLHVERVRPFEPPLSNLRPVVQATREELLKLYPPNERDKLSRKARLLIGSALCLALACASLQKAAERVPPDDRVNAAWLVTREACFACGDKCSADTLARCDVFSPGVKTPSMGAPQSLGGERLTPGEQDDAPHSGDSGPAISQGSAAGLGNGVRGLGGGR